LVTVARSLAPERRTVKADDAVLPWIAPHGDEEDSMGIGVGGRLIVAAVGVAVMLGAGPLRAQGAADACELTLVLGAPQDSRPWGRVEVLVTSARSDALHGCLPIARAVAFSFMQNGENVYVRGFGSLIIKKGPPKPPPPPKVTRAE
jgi:hypothetical protein